MKASFRLKDVILIISISSICVGVILLPINPASDILKSQSVFATIATLGVFVKWGFMFIAIGILGLIVSKFIPRKPVPK